MSFRRKVIFEENAIRIPAEVGEVVVDYSKEEQTVYINNMLNGKQMHGYSMTEDIAREVHAALGVLLNIKPDGE